MEYHILGPLRVLIDGREVPITAARERSVLAMLLLQPNRIVTVDRLIDAVWGDEPPATAKRQLQNCVSALRRKLADAGRPVPTITSDRTGYRITVAWGQLDAQVFAEQVAAAQASLAAGKVAEATDQLRGALLLCRGPALVGCGSATAASATRLDEEYLAAVELCLDLELRLSRYEQVVGELAELVAAHPLRERLVELLMRALYGAGRPADALRVYRELRTSMVDQLGLEPSQRLQQLHTDLLRDGVVGADVGASRTADPPTRHSITVPRQLPAPVRHFAGRTAELATLTELLGAVVPASGAVIISAIGGTAGVGKTAMAVYWAHRVADHFPDGQLYANLRGFSPNGAPMRPQEAIRAFLAALGIPPDQIPIGFEAQIGLYRSRLANRRVLVVLDNASDTAQVRPLLPGSTNCLTLITSRNRLTGLVAVEDAYPINLDLLDLAEARDLLAHRLGRQRVAAEPEAVDELIERCARLPLALAIVAARAAEQPSFPLAAFAAQLADGHQRLDVLDAGDLVSQARAAFSWSYRRLGTAGARLFRLLGVHPGPDIATAAAASLAGLSPHRVQQVLAELTDAHLIAEQVPGRYSFHDLLRAYAIELAGADPAESRAALRRVLEHYLHSARAGGTLLHDGRVMVAEVPEPVDGVTPEQFADAGAAIDWFVVEQPVLRAMINLAAVGFEGHAWRLATELSAFSDRHGDWPEWLSTMLTAVRAAERIGDRAGAAEALYNAASMHIRLSRYDEAEAYLSRAVELYRAEANPNGEAHATVSLGYVLDRQGRKREALEQTERAAQVYRATAPDSVAEARALNNVAWYHAELGDHARAIECGERSLTIFQQVVDRRGEAATADTLGFIHQRLGQYDRAHARYQHALQLRRELRDRYHEAVTLHHLGDLHLAVGDRDLARASWRQALDLLDELGHADADQLRDKLR